MNGIADMPMTERAREAFASQMRQSGDFDYLFPSPRVVSSKPHITKVGKLWDRTLQRAGMPHFSLYELRHTFATRLSAGGVADHFVTQMLRQGDAAVFKRDIVNLRCEGRTCARSARVGQPTVTASQVAKERALTSRW